MELDKFRKRSRVMGRVDMFFSIGAVFASGFWMGYSCPTSHNGGRSTSTRSSSSFNLSACHDARNMSGLSLADNTSQVLIGAFFKEVIWHEEPATGEDMAVAVPIDILASIPQTVAAGVLAIVSVPAPAQQEGVTKKEIICVGCYLLVSSVIGLGYAVWRAVTGAWIGFAGGTLIRGIFVAIVGHSFLKLRSARAVAVLEGKRGGFGGDPKQKSQLWVVTSGGGGTN